MSLFLSLGYLIPTPVLYPVPEVQETVAQVVRTQEEVTVNRTAAPSYRVLESSIAETGTDSEGFLEVPSDADSPFRFTVGDVQRNPPASKLDRPFVTYTIRAEVIADYAV